MASSKLWLQAISTRTPHAGSDRHLVGRFHGLVISTRTPHAGSDLEIDYTATLSGSISTRTPHAGSDVLGQRGSVEVHRFQPALPMRGVTLGIAAEAQALEISTRTPHAGSDRRVAHDASIVRISTRTPHAGSDATPRPAA